jgi:hypothetical protein
MADFALHTPVTDSALAGVAGVDDGSVQLSAMSDGSLAPGAAYKDSISAVQPFRPDEGVTYRYRMRARDLTCLVQPSYVFWPAETAPDLTGAQCPPELLPCGANPLTALSDFVIAASWPVS